MKSYLLIILTSLIFVSCNSKPETESMSSSERMPSERMLSEQHKSDKQIEAEKIFSSEELLEKHLKEGVYFISKDRKCMVCLHSESHFTEVDLIDSNLGSPYEIFDCDIRIEQNRKGKYYIRLIDHGFFSPKQLTLDNGVIYENFEYLPQNEEGKLIYESIFEND